MSTLVQARPSSVQAWVLAARPATLTAAFVPVAVGTACAFSVGGFRPLPALAALLGAFLIQIGTNFANDVFDFEKGTDDENRLGPLRAAQAGLLSPGQLRWGMIVVFGAAVAVGAYLVWVAGPWVIAIGLASIAAGVAYTAGPYALAYLGLGDLFVMIFFGFVAVCGTAFVQVGSVPTLAWWASVPVGALSTAILVVNNVRDAEGDAKAGKRTVVARWGRRAGVWEYAALLFAAYAIPPFLALSDQAGPWVNLPLLTLPIAWPLLRSVARDEKAELNPTLVGTARLLLLYGLLFAVGLST